MAKKKRHHYIPRFYLNGFINPHDKPYIWVYEKGNSSIIKVTAENIAVQKHYYSFRTSSGNIDSETFENALAEIEGKVAPTFQKIKNHEILNDQERSSFAIFIAFIVTRVPNYRENIERVAGELIKKIGMLSASHPMNVKSMVEELERDTGNKIGMPVENSTLAIQAA